jgi:Ca2+-binding EF-hand superfamily protein
MPTDAIAADNTAHTIPDEMLGLWAVPDCRAPERYAYHSKTHVLYLTKDDAMLRPISLKSGGPDYRVLDTDGKQYPFLLHNDGIIEIGILANNMPLITSDNWDNLPIDQRREFMHCEEDLPAPHMISVIALQMLDHLEESCKTDASETCRQKIFDMADHDNNDEISIEEGVEAGLVSLYLDMLLSGDPVKNTVTDKLLQNGYRETSAYMNEMIFQLDQNQSGAISLDELYGLRSDQAQKLSSYPSFQAQQALVKTYPAIGRSN